MAPSRTSTFQLQERRGYVIALELVQYLGTRGQVLVLCPIPLPLHLQVLFPDQHGPELILKDSRIRTPSKRRYT